MNFFHPRFTRLSQLVMVGAGVQRVMDPLGRGKGAIYKVQSFGSSWESALRKQLPIREVPNSTPNPGAYAKMMFTKAKAIRTSLLHHVSPPQH